MSTNKLRISVITHTSGPDNWRSVFKLAERAGIDLDLISNRYHDQPKFSFSLKSYFEALKDSVAEIILSTFVQIRRFGLRSIFTWTPKLIFLTCFRATLFPRRFAETEFKERILARKHLQALTDFNNNNDAEWLLVLEADATKNSKTIEFLQDIQNVKIKLSSDCIWFLSDSSNQITKSIMRTKGPVVLSLETVITETPTSNTTCAYLISKNVASKMTALDDKYRSTPIDWQITYRMMMNDVTSLHSPEPPFDHGSRLSHNSSIR